MFSETKTAKKRLFVYFEVLDILQFGHNLQPLAAFAGALCKGVYKWLKRAKNGTTTA